MQHARLSWRTRAGILVEIESESGLVGQGEASPLPGYSSETYADCQSALAALELGGLSLPDDPLRLDEAWNQVARLLPLRLPAASCAVEAALADLYAKTAEIPLWSLLHALPINSTAPPPTCRKLAALLTKSDGVGLAIQAEQHIAAGFRGLKLKSDGLRPLNVESQRWRAVCGVAHARDVRVRLDANQSWPPSELETWLRAAAELGVEFVEEPLSLRQAWVGPSSPVPTALDESLATLEAWPSREDLERRSVRAIVVKPTLLGLRRSLEAAAWARSRGVAVVVTHTFEGACGYALALAVASAVGSPTHAHGLAPYAILDAAFPHVAFDALTPTELGLPSRPGLGVSTVHRKAP